MASKSMFISVALLVLFCFMVLNEASDIVADYGSFVSEASERHNRKILADPMEEKSGAFFMSGNGNKELNAWELRKVPSGPDPLHHNGNSPKKPRSP